MAPVNILAPVTKETPESSAAMYRDIRIYFNLIGNNILLPLVILTFLFSKTAKRHPILINMCMTWVLSGVFYLLLFYRGQHVGPRLDQNLCIAQASLVIGITPMWSVAVLEMFYYMFHVSRGGFHSSDRWRGLPLAIVLSAPYIVQFSFTIAALLLALQHPEKATRHSYSFFCFVRDAPLFLTMAYFTFAVCVVTIIFAVALAVVIYQSWRNRQSAGLPSELSVPAIVRLFLFGVYVMIGLVVDVLAMYNLSLPGTLFTATAGTVVLLIFGSQGDVFRVWCFWRKNEDSVVDTTTEPAPWKPNFDIRSSGTSLGAIFTSPRSDQRSSLPDRLTPLPSRTRSQPSTRRSSMKTFVRLRDDDELEATYRGMAQRNTIPMGLVESSATNGDRDVIQSRRSSRRPKSNEQKKNMEKRSQMNVELEITGRKRKTRVKPPRPKGPRKASGSKASHSTKPSVVPAGSSVVRKPVASLQLARFSPTLRTFSWTLEGRKVDSSVRTP